MKDSHYRSALDHSTVGYAYNRLIKAKSSEAVGYCILETNPAFEEMTGLSLATVGDRNIYEVFPEIEESGLADLVCFSKIASAGGSTSVEKYSVRHGRWFSIQVFSDEKDHFTTLFTDITDRKKAILNNDELLNLSRSLLDSNDNLLDFNYLTKEICRISGAGFGVFNLYSEDRKKFRNVAIYGKSKLVQTTFKLLGFSLVNKEWDISDTRLNEIKGGHLVRFASLHDLARGVIPEKLCNSISAALNVGTVYVVEISVYSDIIGDFILFFNTGNEILYMSTVTAFANMVGIAINRNNIEKNRLDVEKNLKNFFNAGIDFHWVLDEKGIIMEINDTVKRRLGYSDNELIGKPGLVVHPPEFREKAGSIIESMLQGEDIACHIPLITKSGNHIPVETYVIRGEWNGKAALFGISKDLSQLKMSEDKFYKAFNTSPDIMGLSTLESGIYVEVNKAFCDILGYSQSEVIGKSSYEVLNFDAGIRERLLDKMKKDGFVRNEEIVILSRNGKPLSFLLSAEIIRMQDRDYNLTVAVDITERKVMEESIREREANLKAIIENTLENIWSINTSYEIQYVNEVFSKAFFRTFGVDLKVGMNILKALPESLQAVWKERYDRAFLNEHFLFEDKIDVEGRSIYIEVAMNPIIVDGKVVGASMYGKDVTEKMMAQMQLQYQADLRKLLVDLSTRFINLPVSETGPAVYSSLEKIGEFVGADRAYVFEYDFVNMTATNTLEWCRDNIVKQKDNLQNVPLVNYMEWVNQHKKGKSVKIIDIKESSDSPLKRLLESQNIKSVLTIPLTLQGSCTGFVGFESVTSCHPFTDNEHQLLQVYAQMLVNVKERIDKEKKLVKAKENAEESDRLKSAFLANMSHEIRTPMNGILGFLELLKEPDLSEENKNSYIDIVTQSGQRLLTTLNDIIEVAKIEAGENKVHISDVNTEEMMIFFSGFFRPATVAKGLDLRLKDHLKGKESVLRTDKTKLESMVSNLVKNAVKFTTSGSVELGNFLKDGSMVFYVRDTGPGIPDNRKNIIFERFIQGDMSNSRPHEGSGLGLSIVKGYAGLLGGKVWVESEVGKGSTFYISLPCLKPAGSETIQKSDFPAVVSENEGMTVLVVEDDHAGYLYLEAILTSENYKVIHIANGIDTVNFVRENTTAGLILMDLKIPGITGLEATRQIRKFNTHIPIIAQTAYAFASDKLEAMEAGCNGYILKPIKRNELLEIIRKFTG